MQSDVCCNIALTISDTQGANCSLGFTHAQTRTSRVAGCRGRGRGGRGGCELEFSIEFASGNLETLAALPIRFRRLNYFRVVGANWDFSTGFAHGNTCSPADSIVLNYMRITG